MTANLLPTDAPRIPGVEPRWAEARLRIDPALLDSARAFASAASVGLAELLLAAWVALIARYSGRDEVALLVRGVGRPQSRPNADAARNDRAWLFRTDVAPTTSFACVLERIRTQLTSPLQRLQHASATSAEVQVMFEVTHGVSASETRESRLCGTHGVELHLTLRSTERDLWVELEFRRELFEPKTSQHLLEHYRRLLASIVETPNAPLTRLMPLSAEEENKLAEWSRGTRLVLPPVLQVHELFEAQARRQPSAIAIMQGNVQVRYAELDQRAQQLANDLRATGIGPDVIVGICTDRSPLLVVAILGVLKAGGAYLPLDPELPRDRLAFMIADSRASMILTEERLLHVLPDETPAQRMCLDREWKSIAARPAQDSSPAASARDAAYVIYTSGSTGKPKGVMVSHHAALNFISSMQLVPGVSAEDRVLAIATLSFDIALFELVLPLIAGATIVLANAAERIDPHEIIRLVATHGVTVMQATQTTWGQMLAVGWTGQPGLRALVGGEALSPKLAQDLLERCRELWNMYGPTEATVCATCWRVVEPERGVFLGTPIANTRCLVLDRQGQLAPIGVYGELHIGGPGVARGYVHREELTAARFIADPSDPNARLYRTGDRVRWHVSGQLEFAGRFDRQIKLRGLRIEPGEIEAVLNTCDGVERSVVVVREDRPGDQRLVGYVVGSRPSPKQIREQLARTLPRSLVPSPIIVLEAFPLTPNRKLDLDALPAPGAQLTPDDTQLPTEEMDPLQRSLAAVWEATLHIQAVGLDDNFFDLGGHSLLALNLLMRIAERFDRRLTLASFLESPTVRSQAELLRSGAKAQRTNSPVPIHATGTRTPLFFASGWGGPIFSLRALAKALGPDQPLFLLDYLTDTHVPEDDPTIERIAAKLIVQMRTVRPTGPYQLAGYSLGGSIVYEMARQLQAAGESVPTLILLDHYAPGHPVLPSFLVRTLLHIRQGLRLGPREMWPYLMKYTLRLRRFVVDVEPQLYSGVVDDGSSPLFSDLNRGAQQILRARHRYQIARYAGCVMLIRAEDMSEYGIGAADADPTGGWRDWVADARYIGGLPCKHTQMLDVSNAEQLGELMRRCLSLGVGSRATA